MSTARAARARQAPAPLTAAQGRPSATRPELPTSRPCSSAGSPVAGLTRWAWTRGSPAMLMLPSG
eukprot:10990827-Lingulodinium_polyedra.AAC.1